MEKKTEKDNMDAKLRIKDELRGYRVYIKRNREGQCLFLGSTVL